MFCIFIRGHNIYERGCCMTIDGAVIKEQGVSFAIVVVKSSVLRSSAESNNAMNSFSPLFPGMPIILMTQNSDGTPIYRGRKDIVNFLTNVHPSRIPWKRYTLSWFTFKSFYNTFSKLISQFHNALSWQMDSHVHLWCWWILINIRVHHQFIQIGFQFNPNNIR